MVLQRRPKALRSPYAKCMIKWTRVGIAGSLMGCVDTNFRNLDSMGPVTVDGSLWRLPWTEPGYRTVRRYSTVQSLEDHDLSISLGYLLFLVNNTYCTGGRTSFGLRLVRCSYGLRLFEGEAETLRLRLEGDGGTAVTTAGQSSESCRDPLLLAASSERLERTDDDRQEGIKVWDANGTF